MQPTAKTDTFAKKENMDKEQLIKFCRFYNGEKECPYNDGTHSMFWDYERKWVNFSASSNEVLDDFVTEYQNAMLGKFSNDDNVPISLKALLFNRFSHWNSGNWDSCSESFKEFYNNEYLK